MHTLPPWSNPFSFPDISGPGALYHARQRLHRRNQIGCHGPGRFPTGTNPLRAFVNSLKEAALLPKAILLYNSGIKIALTGTDTAASLQELEEKGVAIIACGTCVDYYEVKISWLWA